MKSGDMAKAARIVSGMSFTPREYAADRNRILVEAFKRCAAGGVELSVETVAALRLLLENAFCDRKALSVENVDMPDRLRDGDSFRICVDGTLAEGIVHLAPKEMSVEITSPHGGREAGAVLQPLAPRIWTERPEPGSEAGEEGRQKAVELLTDLFFTL